MHHKGKSYLVRCFVVNTRTDNLLSRDAATHLGLIQRIASVRKDCDPLFAEQDEKPANCKPVHISLKEDATPYSVHTARRVPIPLTPESKGGARQAEISQGHRRDPSKPTVVSSDASSYGIGGVLLQEQKDGGMRPVAFCSRTLSQAERRYAQIKKECLAAVWCCERFDRYLVGLPTFQLEIDKKPLVPLINNRQLSETPIRCQRMLMRLARFNTEAIYTAGKNMHVADHLSRSPLHEGAESNTEELIAERVNAVSAQWPASDTCLDRLREETRKDDNLQIVMDYTRNGWPTYKEDVKLGARHLFPVRGELSVWEGILVKGDRLLIPSSMRKEILQRLHEGHNGKNKCREHAADTVWWPHISQDIKDHISSCRYCLEKPPSQRKEPLISSALPNYPFERISADICELNNEHYLIVTDAYSRYLEIAYLRQLTSTTVINKMKKSSLIMASL